MRFRIIVSWARTSIAPFILFLFCMLAAFATGAEVTATFSSANTVPLTAAGYTATGNTVNLTLNFAPPTGTSLTVVKNTGTAFIQGSFDNLAQGQNVNLAFGGITYPFVANYYGGTGNDLVLEWANGRLLAWGYNGDYTLGDGTAISRNMPVPVVADGVLTGKTVTRVSLGYGHALALCSDGTLAAWGKGTYGQLGNGSTADYKVPVAVRQDGVLAGKTVVAIAAGYTHSLILCSDGTLASWGDNGGSQLGNGSGGVLSSKSEPVLVDQSGVLAAKTVVAISAGGGHNLVLCSDGTLASWGSNTSGLLGNNSTITSKVPVLVDSSGVLAGKTPVAISAGQTSNLVACSDGTVAAWGENGSIGQLGDGTTIDRWTPVLVDRSGVLAGRAVIGVDARGGNYYNRYHSVALCSDGSVATWGSSSNGQLGNGSTDDSLLPLLAARTGALSGKTIIAVLAGGNTTHALCSDGSMAGWGGNYYGQLGNGSTIDKFSPVAVNGLGTGERIQSVAVGYFSSVLARTALPPAPLAITLAASGLQDTGAQLNGSVSAQGSTTAVSFEYGLTTSYGSTLVAVPSSVSGTAATAVSATLSGLVAGTTYHCRVVATSTGGRVIGEDHTFTTTDMTALAALSLSDGSLAPGFTSTRTSYVATVPNATSSVMVTPVVSQAGATVTVNGTPVASGSSSAAINLAVGNTSISIAVTAAGGSTTRSYGITVTRLPASFTFTAASTVPVTVVDFSAGGFSANLGLSFTPTAGTSLTLVNNTGSEPIRGTFANLAQGQYVNLVYSGISYRFLVDYFGGTGNDLVLRWGNTRLLAWGYNNYGQLGRGNYDDSNVPVAVDMSGMLDGKTVTAVAAGYNHCLAQTGDGRVVAWGNGSYGQLGNNDYNPANVPAEVDWTGVMAGRRVQSLAVLTGFSDSNLALCTDGALVGWGENSSGVITSLTNQNLFAPVLLDYSGALAGRSVASLAAGEMHSLALCTDGTLAAWGAAWYLGTDGKSDGTIPASVNDKGVLAGKTVVAVAAGQRHSLALCSDGTLAAWGDNTYGQLGNGSTTSQQAPVAVNRSGVLAGKTITAISGGNWFSLVLCSDGTLAAWGLGSTGQLGNGSTSQRTNPVLVNRSGVLAGKTVVQISAGGQHALALCSDGTLAAWGENFWGGTLGNGSTTDSSVPVLVNTSALRSGERFLAVVAGGYHSLALVASPPPPIAITQAATDITDSDVTLKGTVNPNAQSASVSFQYGLTTSYGTTVIASPSSLTGTTGTTVSAPIGDLTTGTTYHYRVVATSTAGTIYGEDQTFTTSSFASLSDLILSEGGLLPDFSRSVLNYAASVPNAAATVTVTPVAEYATSTITVNGVSVPSGSTSSPLNLSVGNNTLTVVVTPEGQVFTKTYTVTITRLPAVAMFSSATTVPVTAAAFRASGHTIQFELGFSPTIGASLTVVRNTGNLPIEGVFDNLAQGQRVVMTYGGIDYPFVADYYGGTGNDLTLQWANRSLLAWGDNSLGALGDGTNTSRLVPVPVSSGGVLSGKTPLKLDGGGRHALLACADGTLASWGDNGMGQLGSGTSQSKVPVLVNRSGVLAEPWPIMISAGFGHNLTLCTDGTLASWGYNSDGQLGNGSKSNSAIPVLVPGTGALTGKTPVAVAAGSLHSLVLCSDGTLAGWGSNYNGQLGNGTNNNDSSLPEAVIRSGALYGKTVNAIAVGGYFSMALCSDGTLATWGLGDSGALGNGGDTDSNVPVLVNRSGVLSGKTITTIAAGRNHSLILCSDGTLAAWGNNSYGQLGNGSTTKSNVPVLVNRSGVLSGKTVVGIAAGDYHNLACCSDGSMVAWGYNANGRLGNNSTTNSSTPVLVNTSVLPAGVRMIAAAAGSNCSYAMVASLPAPLATTLEASAITGGSATLNASVYAAGNSTTVRFEYGLTAAYGSSITASPSAVTDATTAAAVNAKIVGLSPGTTYHFRVVATNSKGTFVGQDMSFTTLSNNATLAALTTSAGAPAPAFEKLKFHYFISVANSTNVITITPTTAHPGAKIWIGGKNVVSGTASEPLPLAIGKNSLTVFVTAEDGITTLTYTLVVTRLPAVLALDASGVPPVTADGFFANDLQAMLRLNFHPSPGSTLMLVENTSLAFIYGRFSNLAQGQRVWLSYDGVWYAFVANYHGGTGNDLVLQWAGTRVAAWGLNNYGQLGDGGNTQRLSPVAVNDTGLLAGKTIFAVSTGYLHSVALCSDGTLASWGYNIQGQLGDNGSTQQSMPVPVDMSGALSDKVVVAITSGSYHNLALCSDGTIAAWGYNNHGQLGDGTKLTARSPVLVKMDGALSGKRAVAVAAGAYQSFALCSDGTLAAWGYNDEGELGNGGATGSLVPVNAGGAIAGRKVVEIAAGQYHALALCTDGTVVSWGYNQRGQLGNSSTANSSLPVAIGSYGALAGKSVKTIGAGASHSVALCADGTLAAWGYNSQSQLGTTAISQSTTPVAVALPTGMAGRIKTSFMTGANHTLLHFADDGLAAWGGNASGQLGINSTQTSATAVEVNTSTLDYGGHVMFAASGCASSHNLAVFATPAGEPSDLETWRLENFANIPAGDPSTADCADCDGDGIPNLVEYAFGCDPRNGSDGKLPQPQRKGNRFELRFSRALVAPDIEYGAEWSPDLSPESWRDVPDSGSADEHVFGMPVDTVPRMFMRLRVITRPVK